VTTIVPATGVMLDRILTSTHPLRDDGLTAQAYRRFDAAQLKTAWASQHQRRYALVEDDDVLASATRYDFAAILDEQPVGVCGIGNVITEPDHLGRGHAQALIRGLLDLSVRDGAEVGLLFSDQPPGAHDGFTRIPTTEIEISVQEAARHGAPMTPMRGGEARDLAAVVAMGRVRAGPFRFHLDRDVALVQHAITTRRLLAGLGATGARELHFFIAEEGITAAAYIVLSVVGREWTIEECGDRDASGARVGALLQALIAREPTERRPSIRGWLPHGFVPPQVAIVSATPGTPSLWVCFLGARAAQTQLSGDDVLYWRADIF
jgi:hypothetical protein